MTKHVTPKSWLGCLWDRALRACLLDSELYEEVESDSRAIGQAAVIVLLSASAAGIGSFENGGWIGIAWCAVAALVGWFVWAWCACMIGTRILPQPHTSSDHGELLRTIGFASAPGILRALGLITVLNPWLYVVTGVWMFVAMVIAIRQALDYDSTWRAIAVCVIGAPVEVTLLIISLLFVGPWPV
jgi:hypothetical protein